MRLNSYAVLVVVAALAAAAYILPSPGFPLAPQPFVSDQMATTVHHRNLPGDAGDGGDPAPMSAQHGAGCEAPPAVHVISARKDYVYNCSNHIMTAIDGAPYGAVVLTPSALLDWSSGSATVRWEQSTARGSARDWWDLWLTPPDKRFAIPATSVVDVDLQGQPDVAVTVVLDLFTDRISADAFGVPLESNGYGYIESFGPYFSQVVAPDSARRDTFELIVTPKTLTLRMPLYDQTLLFAVRTVPLPFTEAVVQFAHHSYSPEKGCDLDSRFRPSVGAGGQNCGGGTTYHWSGFALEPAIPLTLLNAQPTYQGGAGTHHFDFGGTAGPGAQLEFTAMGTVDLDFGTGLGFQRAARQREDHDPWKVSMYLVPVPQGASGVDVRLSGDGPVASWAMHAKDLHVWSAASAPDPTPSPTSTPSTSPTPSPTATSTSTVTPTVTPTATPIPTAAPTPPVTSTPTPVPTATSTVSPSPTPSPTPIRCEVRVRVDGIELWREVEPSYCAGAHP